MKKGLPIVVTLLLLFTTLPQPDLLRAAQAAEMRWTQVNTPTAPLPADIGAWAAYDSARSRTVTLVRSAGAVWSSWEYDGGTWHRISDPPFSSPEWLDWVCIAYDSARGRIVVFTDSNELGQTLEYDGSSWQVMHPAVSPSSDRGLGFDSMTYDSIRKRIVLPARDGVTWEYDGVSWVRTSVNGPARDGASVGFDSARGRVVVFGGDEFKGAGVWESPTDTWEYDGTNWTRRNLTPSPPSAWGSGMSYDIGRGRMVLQHDKGATWEYEGNEWRQVPTSLTPAARKTFGLVYDTARKRTILFGGNGDSSFNDTWEYGPTTPPPTQTPIPPTITPTPDLRATAQPWIDEKSRLIPAMQNMDIPTSLFTLPSVPAYNEQAAQELLNRINADLQSGNLLPEQVTAFSRLTLQERALYNALPAYTSAVATLAETAIDSVHIILGYAKAAKLVFGACGRWALVCEGLRSLTEGTTSRLVEDSGNVFINVISSSTDDAETASKAWHLIVATAKNNLDVAAALKDLVIDNALEAGVTRLLITPYLLRSQAHIDKGVRTADPSSSGSDRWLITGSTERAAIAVDGNISQMEIRKDAAEARAADFQKGADILKLAEDISDLTAFSGIGVAVGIGTRIEHLAVNTTLYVLNAQELGCIEFFSTLAATAAFDADRPVETCENRVRGGGELPKRPQISLAAVRTSPQSNPLSLHLNYQAEQYQQAVRALVQSSQSWDEQGAIRAINQLKEIQASMDATLGQTRSILLSQQRLDPNAKNALDQSQQFRVSSVTFYVSVAEHWTAAESGQQPQVKLEEVADAVIGRSQELQQAVAEANPVIPAGSPHLVFAKVSTIGSNSGQVEVEISLHNVGDAEAPEARIALYAGTTNEAHSTPMGAIPAGQELHKTISVPIPMQGSVITAELWAGDELMDVRQIVSEPVASTDTPLRTIPGIITTSTPQATQEVANKPPPATQSNSQFLLIGIGAGSALLILVLGALLVVRRKRPV